MNNGQPHDIQAVAGQGAVILPTLLGSIAKGVMLTSKADKEIDSDSHTSATLSLKFDCKSAQSEHNKVLVQVPIKDETPLTLRIDKACTLPS